MSKNLWRFDEYNNASTAGITDFIKEQIEFLKEITDGNVIAVFTKRRVSSLEFAGSLLQKMLTEAPRANDGAKDASNLYDRICYEYYITDKRKQYELGLFYLILGSNYPVILQNIDETIAEEAEIESNYEINNQNEFEDVYSKIVGTKKVSYVIQRLMNIMKEQDEKGIV